MYKLCRSYQLWQVSMFIIAFSIILPLKANAIPIGSNMVTQINTKDTSGVASVAQDSKTSGTANSVLPLGTIGDFLAQPSSASGTSTEGGVVTGRIHTGLEPFFADVISTWDATFVKDTAGAAFQFNIQSASLELVDFGGPGFGFLLDQEASLDFGILLDSTEVFRHTAEITGKGGTPSTETFQLIQNSGPLSSGGLIKSGISGSGNIDTARLTFDPYIAFVDLSGISVGDTFDITYDLKLHAIGSGGETTATAQFTDPAGFGGISTTISGLTPIFGSIPSPTPAPVPEPATILLLGSGLIGRVWYKKKMRQSNG